MTDSSLPFEIGHRGYSREQVDAYLAQVRTAFAQNEGRIKDLDQQIARLRQELADRDRPVTRVGDRIAEILHLAEQEAAQLRSDADRDGGQIIADARARATRIITTATDDAEVIRRDAEAGAEKRRGELDAERQALDRQRAAIDKRIAALRTALGQAPPIEVTAADDT
ncbi:MAG: DivIVA domain-containing protein [Streptosporangiales bacterium]|nr:DivIVA domain-containing protein [Streptosporangiales bacterium]